MNETLAADLQSSTVLIVDDATANLRIAAEYLERRL